MSQEGYDTSQVLAAPNDLLFDESIGVQVDVFYSDAAAGAEQTSQVVSNSVEVHCAADASAWACPFPGDPNYGEAASVSHFQMEFALLKRSTLEITGTFTAAGGGQSSAQLYRLGELIWESTSAVDGPIPFSTSFEVEPGQLLLRVRSEASVYSNVYQAESSSSHSLVLAFDEVVPIDRTSVGALKAKYE